MSRGKSKNRRARADLMRSRAASDRRRRRRHLEQHARQRLRVWQKTAHQKQAYDGHDVQEIQ